MSYSVYTASGTCPDPSVSAAALSAAVTSSEVKGSRSTGHWRARAQQATLGTAWRWVRCELHTGTLIHYWLLNYLLTALVNVNIALPPPPKGTRKAAGKKSQHTPRSHAIPSPISIHFFDHQLISVLILSMITLITGYGEEMRQIDECALLNALNVFDFS